jgi:hypothetical protein
MTTAAKWQIIRNVSIDKSAPNGRQNIGAIAMERVDERLRGMYVGTVARMAISSTVEMEGSHDSCWLSVFSGV